MENHARRGFGLIEAIAALIVLSILALVIAPNTVALASAERLERATSDIDRLIDALERFETDVHHCPPDLSQFIMPLQGGDQDIVGENYKGGERNRWDGPYYNLLLPASGGPQIGIGEVTSLRAILLDPIIPAIIIEADILDAAALDGARDAGDGANAGAIRWTVISGNLVEIEYRQLGIACAPGQSA